MFNFFNKKKSIQEKIDKLALEIHSLEESNPEITQGSALSRRQIKRIGHDQWVNDVVAKYDHMIKGSH